MTSDQGAASVTHRTVFAIAVPMTLAHVTTPLLGLVDLAVISRTGDAAATGAVTLGAALFSFLFWPFGFLRMGTAGLTAQALGARDQGEQRAVLLRALTIALGIGVALVLSAPLLRIAGLWTTGGSDAVQAATATYFDARIVGAPATLTNYALLGWLVGMGRAGQALALQILLNGANMTLSALLTLHFGWGIAGVAWGTTFAEVIAAAAGLALVMPVLRGAGGRVFDRARMLATFAVNRDIMIRSLFLMAAFLFFARAGAGQGDLTLAANGLLTTIAMTTVYVLDGFATAAEQIAGKALGARDRSAFGRAVRLTLVWSLGFGAGASALLSLGGPAAIDALAPTAEVATLARVYLPYAAAIPICGALAFHLDGVFIGATWTGAMRDMMAAAFAVYLATYTLTAPLIGNHGLWIAFLAFMLARGATLALVYRRQERRSFA